MIDQREAEKAQQFVFDQAEELAKAKAELAYLEEFRKSQKAMLSKRHMEESVRAGVKAPEWMCADYAYSHKDYLEVLVGIRVATERFEKLRFEVESARMKVNIWQTQSANQRV